MKVMQITAFSGSSSTGKIAQGISELLMEKGHEAVVAWGRINNSQSKVPTIQIGTKKDYLFHGLYARITDRNGFASKRATKELIKKIEQYRPDIIHLHILHGYYINIEILFTYLKEKKIPVVWTFHDEWAFTGHCPCFRQIKCDKWKSECHHCVQRKEHPASLFVDRSRKNFRDKKRLFTGVDKLVVAAPSAWMKSMVKESFLKDCAVRVIHNGIDTACFTPTESDIKEQLGIKDKKIVLGVSSTWVDAKGFQDFKQLPSCLGENYQVVLVGVSQAQKKELPPEIIGIERTDSAKELAKLYTAAEVFCNLTYDDNYPTTNLEAVACGTPVITYRTGGSVEIVEETGYGMVVPCGDVAAVAEAVRKIEQLPRKTEGFRNVEQKECYEEYIKLYKELLNE